MKPQNAAPQNKKPARARRKSREEIDQEARERKRQKKHRGHAAGSRSGAQGASVSGKGTGTAKDPRLGSKKPVQLGTVDTPVTPAPKKVKSEKPAALTPEAELMLLENDDRLDALLERLEEGETLSKADQDWVDKTLDRIDELMAQLGIAYDDEDEEEEEKTDDLMRLLKGN